MMTTEKADPASLIARTALVFWAGSPADLEIAGGCFVAASTDDPTKAELTDAEGRLCIPGFVESHMADAAQRFGGRLISTFGLPMRHPDEAIAELRRCVDIHKLRCAVICPNVHGGRTDELPLWDLFAKAKRLSVMLAFHGDADTRSGSSGSARSIIAATPATIRRPGTEIQFVGEELA